jgi:putative cell wall-binding protein
MSKRFISTILVVMIVLTSNSNLLYAYADSLISTAEETGTQSGTCGDNAKWLLEDGVLTISGSGDMYDYSYFEIKNYTPWYSMSEDITEVKIEKGITSIGANAFYNFRALESITIPDGIISIGEGAFRYCQVIPSITIPDSVTTMGSHVFFNCKKLETMVIPNSVTSMGGYTFSGCTSLKSVTLPESLTEIGQYNFNNCKSLTNITIPKSVTSIAKYGFYGCAALTSITIPESVTSIGDHAFYDCTGLESITIPASVTEIASYAFTNCAKLTSIEIPGLVTEIGDHTFSRCSSLTSVTLPKSVKSMGRYVFANCTSLTSVTIPEAVTSIGNFTFNNCTSLTKVIMEGTTAPAVEASTLSGLNASCQIEVPFGATGYDAAPWTSYDIFEKEEVKLEGQCGDNANWKFSDGVLSITGSGNMYEYSQGSAPWYPLVDEITEVKIEDGVTSVGSYAFNNVKNLTNITIPSAITSIGDGAFSGCAGLNKIIMKSSKASTIGTSTFEGIAKSFVIIVPTGATGYDSWSNVKYISSAPSIVASISSGKVQLKWEADNSAEKFEIYRSDSENGTYEKIATVEETTYTDATVARGKVYYYKAKAINETYPELNSELSKVVSAKVILETPVLAGTNDKDGNIVISWKSVANASSYEIYRGTAANNVALLLTTASTSYLDNETERGATYFYKVKAVFKDDETLNSAYSNFVEMTDETIATGAEALFPERVNSIRFGGANRYDTSIGTANAVKSSMAVAKFENIVVAYGDDYADALAGNYLAKVKNAPILIVNKSSESKIKSYIDANLASGGTVYLLGGTGVVSTTFEKSLSQYNVKRLGGKNRFATNMQILKETGVTVDEVLVCSAYGFADSLSASAVGKPILLVGDKLTDEQKTYLSSLGKKSYYIIGGTGAVTQAIENELKTYGTVERVAGANRYSTSAEVAKTFFEDSSDTVVLAYGLNFPDGLSGGPLAMSLGAPLLLVSSNSINNASASAYVTATAVDKAVCLGGSALISDTAVKEILGSK